jgi:hypothetical protein
MKLIKIALFSVLFVLANVTADGPVKCPNCLDFPKHSGEDHPLDEKLWTNERCYCSAKDGIQKPIEVEENVTIYCCYRGVAVQGFGRWLRNRWNDIKKVFSNVQVGGEINIQRRF